MFDILLKLKDYSINTALKVYPNIETLLIHLVIITLLFSTGQLLYKVLFTKITYIFINKHKKDNSTLLTNLHSNKLIPHFISALLINIYVINFVSKTNFFWLTKLNNIYLAFLILLIIDFLLKYFIIFYKNFNLPDSFNIKGISQAFRIIFICLFFVYTISILINQSPWQIISSIGALTAILLLVFKDSILGFVAGIQLFANNMLKVGDWIEMPSFLADGTVIDISITVVKVQNWDKTIVYIPSYSLVSNTFKNWNGMQESKGRRIKRKIYIDVNSLCFLSQENLNTLKEEKMLVNFFKNQFNLIKDSNHLTNLKLFREYINYYILNNNEFKKEKSFTLLVRTLESNHLGIPLEIYCFTNTIDWKEYENIQSSLFENLLVLAKLFKLKIFQMSNNSILINNEKKYQL